MAGFAPARRANTKARIGIYGAGGSGKTMASLLIAQGLVPGGRVALADCEGGKSAQYGSDFAFETVVLGSPFTPPRLMWAVEQAVKGKFDVLIVDGISPFWSGPGGVLSVVDASKNRGGGWAEGTPTHQKIIDAIVHCPIHIIVTMRAKNDTVVESNGGKTTIRKIGLKYDQRDNVEYDLGWLLYAEHGTHALTVEKTTMIGQQGKLYAPVEGSSEQPAEEFGKEIAAWLAEGTTPAAPETAQEPVSAPPAATPPATPAAQPAPASAPPVDAGSLLDAEPAKPAATDEQQAAIATKIDALRALRPDTDWNAAILPKIEAWFGVKTFEALAGPDADELLTRLEQTRLKIEAPADPKEK